jgi:hypothetical protein
VAAMHGLGLSYFNGHGVAKSLQASNEWFEKAAAGGSKMAASYVGWRCLEMGKLDEAIAWLENCLALPVVAVIDSPMNTESVREVSTHRPCEAYLTRLCGEDDGKIAQLLATAQPSSECIRNAFCELSVRRQTEEAFMRETYGLLYEQILAKDLKAQVGARFLRYGTPPCNNLALHWLPEDDGGKARQAAEFAVGLDAGNFQTCAHLVKGFFKELTKLGESDANFVAKFLRCQGITVGCMACGKTLRDVRFCRDCKKTSYCSKNCQKTHWKSSHSRVCKDCASLPQMLRNDEVMHLSLEASRLLADISEQMVSYSGSRRAPERGLSRLTELLDKKAELVKKMEDERAEFFK